MPSARDAGRGPTDPGQTIHGINVMSIVSDAPPARPSVRGWLAAAGYATMLLSAAGAFLVIRSLGEGLVAPEIPAGAVSVARPNAGKVDVVFHVFATMAAVIALGYGLGRLFVLVGQPPVIGEVIAGIALGPSLLGAIWPDAMQALIPGPDADPKGQVASALTAVSQLGVVMYMFLVGLELNADKLKKQAHAAVAVSHASIVAPFVLGSALALWLYPNLSHRGVPFTSFALFMGAAMAVTAFPVLARILADRRLDKTDVGVTALGCAAADDITAWCLVAFVSGVARYELSAAEEGTTGLLNSALVGVYALVFIAVMFLVVRPVAARVARRFDDAPGPLPRGALLGTLIAVLAAALTTEVIGVHAVIGAFLLGAVIPHDSRLAGEVTKKLHDVVTVLLLPAFFALTGMRTRLGLMNSAEDWVFCAAIVLVATLGKFGGTVAAARITGLDWRTSAALGSLMNTRGLMGLIVLNLGLSMGVISPTLFAMMVIMAVVTTMATAPVLDRLVPTPTPEPVA